MTLWGRYDSDRRKARVLGLVWPLAEGAMALLVLSPFLWVLFSGIPVVVSGGWPRFLRDYWPHYAYLALSLLILGAFVFWLASRNAPSRILGRIEALPVPTSALKDAVESLDSMSIAAGLPAKPSLWLIESDAVNAAVVGFGAHDARFVLTSGLLQELTQQELDAAFAHMCARVASGDMVLGTSRAIMVSLLPRIQADEAEGPLSPNWLLNQAVFGGSRRRSRLSLERADVGALFLLKDPDALLSAIRVIGDADNYVPGVGPALAPLFISWPDYAPEMPFIGDHDLERLNKIAALRHEPIPG